MPQPPVHIQSYLAKPLPVFKEQYPPGTGGTGPRAEWPEGTLKGVEVIEGFEGKVNKYIKSLPDKTVTPHPAHKYPKFVQAIASLPNVIKTPADLQKCLSVPLEAISATLTAIEYEKQGGGASDAKALDAAGYESDGCEEVTQPKLDDSKTKAWQWRFNKSPMGSGEFYLTQHGSDKVHLIVRTINSAAFSSFDWDEFVVTGPYHYATNSKASWYWSRTWGASKRLGCQYWVLTDWQRWVFGNFDDGRTHGFVSPLQRYDAVDPSVLQTLFYWARSAIGTEGGFDDKPKDVSSLPALFPPNPARRVSVSGNRPTKAKDPRKVKTANESDIEESDAEAVDVE